MNRLPGTSRTAEEVVAEIERVKDYDWMGTITNDLLVHLPFEHAGPLLKEGATEATWDDARRASLMTPLDHMLDYLPFAWDKANNCRGLSASRSMDHMHAWLFLLGADEATLTWLHEYDHYGKEQLIFCSGVCGLDWHKHDNGEWVNDEDQPSLGKAGIEARAELARNSAMEFRAGMVERGLL